MFLNMGIALQLLFLKQEQDTSILSTFIEKLNMQFTEYEPTLLLFPFTDRPINIVNHNSDANNIGNTVLNVYVFNTMLYYI